ncbi:MAG: 7-carboxy-7-deazaguanine synthase QueE [Candidatus Omnitrophica bacterium]|nr:7-carboxy-7-deazaguanine synthase QueE [Candidatus Omnitrophota bacterium]
MKEAKISEIFLSLQGEGIYLGTRQLFIRFYGCNLSCAFCDTKLDSYGSFTRSSLMSRILEHSEPYHSISFTGGEPLLQADFIRDFLHEYRKFYDKTIYLETNGTLHGGITKVIDYVDIIAMDFKLPSSTAEVAHWELHEKFLKVAKRKEVFVKAVVTPATSVSDILRMRNIIVRISSDIAVVLQPVTPPEGGDRINESVTEYFKTLIGEKMKRVEIIPQVHRILGIK